MIDQVLQSENVSELVDLPETVNQWLMACYLETGIPIGGDDIDLSMRWSDDRQHQFIIFCWRVTRTPYRLEVSVPTLHACHELMPGVGRLH